jgi:hypothetical protein
MYKMYFIEYYYAAWGCSFLTENEMGTRYDRSFWDHCVTITFEIYTFVNTE